ncbi:unnamed protein product [Protopolystoma xenopodis]|uniref:Cullin family profile domain-containing protein n=1 Tax=Protopolystoma xenopodis TaxID=117903 RepID=A0A448XLM7_9PLAT|nr:unnamed protein product [Protopolystoma xenopodis]
MMSLREEFSRFYLSHHQGRRLTYEPSLGTCVVKATFDKSPDCRKELQVSEFQAIVLLQFNNISSEEGISYKHLLDATGIEEAELKRTLLSLSAGKGQRVLIKKPSVILENIIISYIFESITKFIKSYLLIYLTIALINAHHFIGQKPSRKNSTHRLSLYRGGLTWYLQFFCVVRS